MVVVVVVVGVVVVVVVVVVVLVSGVHGLVLKFHTGLEARLRHQKTARAALALRKKPGVRSERLVVFPKEGTPI